MGSPQRQEERNPAALNSAAEAPRARQGTERSSPSMPFPLSAFSSLASGAPMGSPDWEGMLRGAQRWLAQHGQLSEAIRYCQRASGQHLPLRADQMGGMVNNMMRCLRSHGGIPAAAPRNDQAPVLEWELFSCRKCQGFLHEPVSLPCGHTFCKKCLEKEKSQEGRAACNLCVGGTLAPDELRVNVVLSNLLSKCFPGRVSASRLRHEGNRLYKEKKLAAALQKYNEAVRLAPNDHLLYINRSQIHSLLHHHEEAFQDAEMACKLHPMWVKGHLRKGQSLAKLGKTEDALNEFLFCLALDAGNKTARLEAQKAKIQMKLELGARMGSIEGARCSGLGQSSSGAGSMNGKQASSASETDSLKSKKCQPKKRNSDEAPKTAAPGKKAKKNGSEEQGAGARAGARAAPARAAPAAAENVQNGVVELADMECSLCMRIFLEPVTTPCGHTFCLRCLQRCLDHNPMCPLCKKSLEEYLAMRTYCTTVLMEDIMAKHLSADFMERKRIYQEELIELSDMHKNVPIFVCTLAYPFVPCPLHVFEPSYKLMLRRCLETGTRQFGMCLADPIKGFSDIGCILEIRSVEFYADGRSVVETVGKDRFTVLRRGQRDGYHTADIEYIEDETIKEEQLDDVIQFHDAVYEESIYWFDNLRDNLKERILNQFGPMPAKGSEVQAKPNGPAWCWWMLAVLPLEAKTHIPFLTTITLKDRLWIIKRILAFLSYFQTHEKEEEEIL